MAWYDEPGDYQTDTSYGGTYDPSGGDIQQIQLPGQGSRMPWETEFTPNSWIYSKQAEAWNQAEKILRDKNVKRLQELENLQKLLGYYEGSGDFVTQWLIGNSMKQIRSRMEDTDKAIGMGQLRMQQARRTAEGETYRNDVSEYEQRVSDWQKEEDRRDWRSKSNPSLGPQRPIDEREKPELPAGWSDERLAQRERWLGMANRPLRTDEQKNTEYPDLEIPEWMEGFMADTETGLAPLSARADLDAEEMGGLQSYMGYVKADRPQFYSEDYVQKMQNLPNWWEKYTKESQKLFPTSGKARTTSWSTARQ